MQSLKQNVSRMRATKVAPRECVLPLGLPFSAQIGGFRALGSWRPKMDLNRDFSLVPCVDPEDRAVKETKDNLMKTYTDLADEFNARIAMEAQHYEKGGVEGEDPEDEVERFEWVCVRTAIDAVFGPKREYSDEEMVAIFLAMPENPHAPGKRDEILEAFHQAARGYVEFGVECHAVENWAEKLKLREPQPGKTPQPK